MSFQVETLKNQVLALILNLYAYFLSFFFNTTRRLRERAKDTPYDNPCVQISRPGGLDRLEVADLHENLATVGYNVEGLKKGEIFKDVSNKKLIPSDLVVVKIKSFSINYADICIRWGLYESALRYVGWPIVPGFDFAGEVEHAGSDTEFSVGEKVFGFTMFGAYSSRLLVPSSQIRKIPSKLSLDQAAAIPAVAATALHALALAGAWPGPLITSNKAVMIHSAAGGVGSMLLQMCKVLGYTKIVAVVGRPNKAEYCRSLGADYVIVKSTSDLWKEAEKMSPDGYVTIFDANGVETLGNGYQHLCRCGKLVSYGFHSNLPKSAMLSPLHWVDMIWGLIKMPRFDAMQMVLDSKSVCGFNLSFFSEEHEVITKYLQQILKWVQDNKIKAPDLTTFDITEVDLAHEMIQSGNSVGKFVIKTSSE